jgi:hypothetical protein
VPDVIVRRSGNAEITVDTRTLSKLIRDLPNRFARILAGSAFEVEVFGKALAPVDTGALANSISVWQKDDYTFWIGPSVEYGIYQELGWHDRGGNEHPGRFYMTKALLQEVPRVNAVLRAVLAAPGGFTKILS